MKRYVRFRRAIAEVFAPPPRETSVEADKQRRVNSLTEDERKAFEWLNAGYTPRWTAETMLLDKRDAKALFSSLYRKLGVHNARKLLQLYGKKPLSWDDLPKENDLGRTT